MIDDCTACQWETLTTTWDITGPVAWRVLTWTCPTHTAVVLPDVAAILEAPSEESPLLDGDPVEGVVVESS